MLMRRYGRLPVLFWSQAREIWNGLLCLVPTYSVTMVQVLALGFLVGCAVAPNIKTFTGQYILRWGHLWARAHDEQRCDA